MKLIPFLLLACVIMAVCLGGLSGWLLPQFGLEGMPANAIGGGLGGALIAILYVRMVKKPNGERQ